MLFASFPIIVCKRGRNGFSGCFDYFHFSLENGHRCCSEKGCYCRANRSLELELQPRFSNWNLSRCLLLKLIPLKTKVESLCFNRQRRGQAGRNVLRKVGQSREDNQSCLPSSEVEGSTYRTRDEITGVRQVGYPGRIGIWEASLS
ncbi:hypothetical protein MRB53_026498 [Persea americana]|uniref:Uncharacterized protein n=1 Tax=Persea americana TaxID=3435 RepID=A0ACC2LI74_PERAE|nr:hypothetical protein MRB53_026498 [Persea americana]